jgi:hypothetical protein
VRLFDVAARVHVSWRGLALNLKDWICMDDLRCKNTVDVHMYN